ncbi:MAG TPA: integrase arm-type DNA-binding domain-containing protein [Caulobacteraceae bacterium]|jgi:integrase
MPRVVNRLSARGVATLKAAGRYADGAGLYLHITPEGSKSWVFVFQWLGRRKEMGLGSVSIISLSEARDARDQARKIVAQGVNPIEERKKAAPPKPKTFGEFADEMVAEWSPGWKNPKHIAQWSMTLTTHAASLRPKAIGTISTDDVLLVLRPIWTKRPETASRLRGRIERVLDAARVKGLRTGENPARWKGHLEQLLSKPVKLSRGHHPALAYEELPAFMTELRARTGVSLRALEFTILTVAREGMTLGAAWSEIDFAARLWTVPAARMKTGKEHRIPLGPRALELLSGMKGLSEDWVFPGPISGRPLSNMAMDMALRRLRTGVTVHGFRSTFRDWAGDCTPYPREIAEAALAHSVGDRVELAYRRADALQKRRRMMDDWERFCARPVDNVVPLDTYRATDLVHAPSEEP